MPIVSDREYVAGKPRIEGTRIWVSHVVNGIVALGSTERYSEEFGITYAQIKEALDYCRNERCTGNVVKYCRDCAKDTSPPIRDEPEKGIHVLGDVTLDVALREWDPQSQVLIIGTEEIINRKQELWKVAEQLYRRIFLERC